MTIAQLTEKHGEAITDAEQIGISHSNEADSHTTISIEYAIGEIEQLKKDLEMGFPFSDQPRIHNWLTNRMAELKMLIK